MGAVLSVIRIDIDPVLVKIGPFSIHWYGVMYVVGILTALVVVLPYVERRGVKRDTALNIFFPIVIGGLVGGRLYYVVQSNFGYFLSHPLKIFATWEGGMAFFGAIIGASALIVYECWRKRLPVWIVLDAGAIFAPLGQAFGRVGNIINGDIVGFQSNCAWCTRYVNPHSFVKNHTVAYQPAAAYELLISLAIFALVYALRFRFPRGGMLFALYLALYAVSQFGIFFVRASEPVTYLGLKQAQLTAVVVFIAALALMVFIARSRGSKLTWLRFTDPREIASYEVSTSSSIMMTGVDEDARSEGTSRVGGDGDEEEDSESPASEASATS